MKVVEMSEATLSLSEYARRNRRQALVVTRRGRPVSALVPLDSQADLERLSLSTNPRFQAILERSREQVRQGQVFTTEEMRRHFGLPRKRR